VRDIGSKTEIHGIAREHCTQIVFPSLSDRLIYGFVDVVLAFYSIVVHQIPLWQETQPGPFLPYINECFNEGVFQSIGLLS
jgi:hypothetical protein